MAKSETVFLLSPAGLALAAHDGAVVVRPLLRADGWPRAFQWRVTGLGTTFDPVVLFENLGEGGLLTLVDAAAAGGFGLRAPATAGDDGVWNVQAIGHTLSWHWWLNALPRNVLARPYDVAELFFGAGGGFSIRLNADTSRTLAVRDAGGGVHATWLPAWVPATSLAVAL
jgi:hypothetical protein